MATVLSDVYLSSIIILIVAVLLSKFVHSFMKRKKIHFLADNEIQLDEAIAMALEKPIIAVIISGAIYTILLMLPETKGGYAIINQIFFSWVVLIVTHTVTKIINLFTNRWLKVHHKFSKTPKIMNNLTTIFVYFIGISIILLHFDVEITPLIATLGVGGLAVGLALQDTLSNFFAGLYLVSDKPIKVGDYVEIDGQMTGFVEDIGWRTTKIRTLENKEVIVPNKKLSESIITNDSTPEEKINVTVECGVSLKSDLKKVEKITMEVARNIQHTAQGAVKTYDPSVRFTGFGEDHIRLRIRLQVDKYTDRYRVVHEFIKALKTRYDKESIVIAFKGSK